MNETAFVDAFLDQQYLKLDERALGFIFGPERLAAATSLPVAEAKALLAAHREQVLEIVVDTARRILRDTFYDRLFEELAALPGPVAGAFINLALGRVEDAGIEAARAETVKRIQESRRPRPSQ